MALPEPLRIVIDLTVHRPRANQARYNALRAVWGAILAGAPTDVVQWGIGYLGVRWD